MKKKIIICILIVIIVTGLWLPFIITKFSKNNQSIIENIKYPNDTQEENSKCLVKGKVCTDEQILSGIQVTISVAENKNVDFYVIDNSESDMTLLSKELVLEKSQWYFQTANYFGPNTVLENLYVATNDWTNIDVISDYKYNDKGYQLYRDVCVNHTLEFENYNCNNLNWGAGYKTFIISNGNGTAKTSHDTFYEMEGKGIRTRNVTVEEIEKLIGPAQEHISWLKNIKPFWTLTSASDPVNDYTKKAYAVRNSSHTESGVELYPYDVVEENEVGIRAVITINKLEGEL